MYGRGMYSPIMNGTGNYMPYMAGMRIAPRVGLIGRLGGAVNAIRGVNWSGLFTNAGRALGVVNQAIPIVKQAGPMVRNVKSMFKLASAFRDETSDNNKEKSATNNNNQSSSNNNIKKTVDNNPNNTIKQDNNSPNFFL